MVIPRLWTPAVFNKIKILSYSIMDLSETLRNRVNVILGQIAQINPEIAATRQQPWARQTPRHVHERHIELLGQLSDLQLETERIRDQLAQIHGPTPEEVQRNRTRALRRAILDERTAAREAAERAAERNPLAAAAEVDESRAMSLSRSRSRSRTRTRTRTRSRSRSGSRRRPPGGGGKKTRRRR